MKVTVNTNFDGIRKKIVALKSNQAFGNYAAQQAADLMEKYVPERDHNLINAVITPWTVKYITPYARYQYNGVSKGGKSLRYTKPSAQSKWDTHINKGDLARRLSAWIKGR